MDVRRRLIKQIGDKGPHTPRLRASQENKNQQVQIHNTYWDALWRGDAGQLPGRCMVLVLLFATVFYGMTLGGHLGDDQGEDIALSDRLGRMIGLKIGQINVEGSRHLDAKMVLKALGLKRHSSMLTFDVNAARIQLEKVNWVAHAQVLKLFPGRVFIKITERVPYAIWQLKGRHSLIDRGGKVLSAAQRSDYPDLPLVVGAGAGVDAQNIWRAVSSQKDLKTRVLALVRVADRRWNVKFHSGLTLMLPEKKQALALSEFVAMAEKHKFFSRNLALVDFRLPDRITLRPAKPETAENLKKRPVSLSPVGAVKRVLG